MTAASNESRRVVVGVDGSGNSDGAILWAAGEAVLRGATLYLVHAAYFDEGSDSTQSPGEPAAEPAHSAYQRVLAKAERQVRAMYPSVPIVSELVHGGTAEALIAASAPADVLAVGTYGCGSVVGLVLGSTCQSMIVHARCPVVVVRSSAQALRQGGDVTLAMDHGASDAAVRFAFDAAARGGTAVHVVHALVSRPGCAQQLVSDDDIVVWHLAEEMATTMKGVREKYPSVPVTTSVVRGDPIAVLLAASRDARLTVLGMRRRHGLASLGVSPKIAGLLAHAHSPVAVVHT